MVTRPNRLGHSNKTKVKVARQGNWQNFDCLQARNHENMMVCTVSAVKMALRNDHENWYSVGRDSIML